MKKNIQITEESKAFSCYLRVSGDVNTLTAGVLEEALGRKIADKANITLNMNQVGFLSSMGIRVILGAYKKASKLGLILRIDNPSENVKNVLGMTALDELLLNK